MKLSRLMIPLTLFSLSLSPSLVHAQEAGKPPPVSPSEANMEALYNASTDIGRLRALNILKLTDAELDKIVIVVSDSQKAYQKQYKAMLTKLLLKLEPSLKKTKKDGLAGKDIDYEEETRKALDDLPKRVTVLDQDYAVRYVEQLKPLLTKVQITAAASFAKLERQKLNPEAKGTEDQWFNFYVNSIFSYGRLLPLLQEMQTARKAPKEKLEVPPPP
ncbi:MAG: hypothetical protein H7308_12370 [Chthonomonadaceae bacterium]|nr:hypothetical protein [Chthonomonadaceae bacterium]